MASAPTSLVFVSTITLLLACGRSSDGKDPLLLEAIEYHQQATAIQALVEPQLEQADSIKATLLAQKAPAAARIATLDSLKRAFEAWEMNLVEIPGMPHSHTHNHGDHAHHHHADATFNDLPAEQMRDLQRETLNNIRQIQERLDEVTRTL